MGPIVQLRGVEFSTIGGTDGGPPLFDVPLPVSFEVVQQQLMQIPRMDLEPDGYFLVAGGEQEGARWQIDGHLFEYDGKMHRLEMHGSCSTATLDQILDCLGGCDFVFQLVHEGATLSEPDFRRWAAQPAG